MTIFINLVPNTHYAPQIILLRMSTIIVSNHQIIDEALLIEQILSRMPRAITKGKENLGDPWQLREFEHSVESAK